MGRQGRGHYSDRTRGRGHEAHQGHRRTNPGALSTSRAPVTAWRASACEASPNSVGSIARIVHERVCDLFAEFLARVLLVF